MSSTTAMPSQSRTTHGTQRFPTIPPVKTKPGRPPVAPLKQRSEFSDSEVKLILADPMKAVTLLKEAHPESVSLSETRTYTEVRINGHPTFVVSMIDKLRDFCQVARIGLAKAHADREFTKVCNDQIRAFVHVYRKS